MKSELRQSAIIRHIELIGEAVKHIPEDFRKNILLLNGKKLQVREI